MVGKGGKYAAMENRLASLVPAAGTIKNRRGKRRMPDAEAIVPFVADRPTAEIAPGMRKVGDLLVRDWGPIEGGIRRIIVLKLDHHGDFIIGLPALRKLRAAFPGASIRLVCGSWNRAAAEATGLVDEVKTYDYYPENAAGWNGHPVDDRRAFAEATAGEFDLAIDLRADEDARHLLAQIDAKLRCGIGSRLRFPMLDIALPAARALPSDVNAGLFLGVDRFTSRMAIKTPLFHETGWPAAAGYVAFGPYVQLPPGRFHAMFGIHLFGVVPGPRRFSVSIDVCRDQHNIVARKTFNWPHESRLARQATLEFVNPNDAGAYEFRIYMGGRPLAGRLRFTGVLLDATTDQLSAVARFKPAELHVGELLALLVALVVERTANFGFTERSTMPPTLPRPDWAAEIPAGCRRVIVSPISNSTIRDWPASSYAALIELLLDRLDCCVILIGSPQQMEAVRRVREGLPKSDRVIDLSGRTTWAEVGHLLSDADLVVGNNSAVVHRAAGLGVATLGVYSGSHQPQEWGPRGWRSRALMAAVTCSPCGFESVRDCPRDHLCMKMITPEMVLANALELIVNKGSPGGDVPSPEPSA